MLRIISRKEFKFSHVEKNVSGLFNEVEVIIQLT